MWGTAQALNGIGDMARVLGDYDRASSLYTESLHLYRQLRVKRDIPASLHNLGHVALAKNDSLTAKTFFQEGLRLQQELGNKYGVIECLVGLAGVAATTQDPVRAVRLLGISAQVRGESGRTFWPAEQGMYEHTLSATHSELDEAAWNAAWSEGQEMSLEAAVDYALEGESLA
jgi:hypothetical protein